MIVHGFSVSYWDIEFKNIKWAKLPCKKPEISDRLYLTAINVKNKWWVSVSQLGFLGSWDPLTSPPPSRVRVPGPQESLSGKNWNTVIL